MESARFLCFREDVGEHAVIAAIKQLQRKRFRAIRKIPFFFPGFPNPEKRIRETVRVGGREGGRVGDWEQQWLKEL